MVLSALKWFFQGSSSWFFESLQSWREMNCTTIFGNFCAAVYPLSGTLPQLVFHQNLVISFLLEYLQVPNSLAICPLASLTAMLAKDLGQDFYPHSCKFLTTFIDII